MTHTPGPWYVTRDIAGHWFGEKSKGTPAFMIPGTGLPESGNDDNALLIVAAPDMLAALKHALCLLPVLQPHDPNYYRYRAIIDAIAKATKPD